MFLNALQKQNPALIKAAHLFWQQGKILPDSYVIDSDQLLDNAHLLLDKANQLGITLYAMTKQIGRNPWICRQLLKMGYAGIVAVDFKEARQLYQHNIPIAHIGHLVQPPQAMLEQIIQQKPHVITIFSLEKAKSISDLAQKYHYVQPVLIKVYQESDALYPGQEAGFALAKLEETIQILKTLPGIQLIGATHFPCLLFDNVKQQSQFTANFNTLKQATALLQKHITVKQCNAPSLNCCETLPLLAKQGVTHAEPGHALTGTQPSNQQGTQAEKIAMLYLSEVSHHYKDKSYCFGGGYYRRGHLQNAYVINQTQTAHTTVIPPDNDAIDYHIGLQGIHPIGSAVIMCFRTQIFVTRSDVVLIKGCATNQPELIGVYDSLGNLISGEN